MSDLFAPEAKPMTVTEVTRTVRAVLESQVGEIWVEGEVCNHRKQASGHQYFTLKDEKSQLPCVLFQRGPWQRRQITLTEGMCVQARGALTVYEARGVYQLNVQLVQAAGAGLLQAKFEALKRKLEAEGLFAQEHKKPLPRFPTALGVVTSPTGAVIRDVLNVLARRAPWLRVIVAPVRVQGVGAAAEIAEAVTQFNRAEEHGLPPVDVILVCRGGGSSEDLWAFNEEVLARAIFASETPVISAVGHEIDFTISDFVADLRAPTPSAAAELVAPDRAQLRQRFQQCHLSLERRLRGQLAEWGARLAFIRRSVLFREPVNRLAHHAQHVDLLDESLQREVRAQIGTWRQELLALQGVLRRHRPDQLLKIRREQLGASRERLREKTLAGLVARRAQLEQMRGILRVLAPQATLERGFSITTRPDGTLLRSAAEAGAGDEILTRLRDGSVNSRVE